MGIYLPNMEMPKDCNHCRFSGFGGLRNERIVCMFTGSNDYLNQQERFSDCPLIEVLPHGDLIDRDALCKHIEDLSDNMWTNNFGVSEQRLFDAPTVIEAEEGT